MPTLTMTKSKTKTLLLTTLAIVSAGSVLAGMLYFYSARNLNFMSSGGSLLYISRISHNFANVLVSTTSQAPPITIRNNGNTSLNINSVSLAGSNTDQFSLNNNCAGTLAPGSSCTITATFQPSSTGTKSATINISTQSGTHAISLTGEGIEEGDGGGGGGSVDLTFPASQYGTGGYASEAIRAGTSIRSHHPFNVSTTFLNQGLDPSGDFTIKLYSSFAVPRIDEHSVLLGTYWQSSLAPGQSASYQFTGRIGSYTIHAQYYYIIKLDADNQIGETSEDNNEVFRSFSVAR